MAETKAAVDRHLATRDIDILFEPPNESREVRHLNLKIAVADGCAEDVFVLARVVSDGCAEHVIFLSSEWDQATETPDAAAAFAAAERGEEGPVQVLESINKSRSAIKEKAGTAMAMLYTRGMFNKDDVRKMRK
jgi:hypothetical protein